MLLCTSDVDVRLHLPWVMLGDRHPCACCRPVMKRVTSMKLTSDIDM
jgi:hypothetical protein